MGEEVKTVDTSQTQVVDEKVLEKSFNESMSSLKSVLEKAKKKGKTKEQSPDTESDLYESSDSEESESSSSEEEESTMKKSITDLISEDPEADAAMDVEPFLKSLANGIEISLEDKVTRLEKSINYLTKVVKALGGAIVAQSEFQKSIDIKVQKIGETPIPSGSVLSKSKGRFDSNGKEIILSKAQIMTKAIELCKSNQISTMDVALLEGRLNKGLDIPENLKSFFEGGK